jgi:predicted Zn-dependent peptidase
VSGAFLFTLSFMVLAVPALPAGADVVTRELPSGVQVIVLRDRSSPLVAARALWRGGQRGEPDGLAGIDQVLAAAWTGGCGERDGDEIARALEADSAAMAGVAGRETLGLRAEWTRAGWEQGFELLADCVARPRFQADAVRRARERLRALLVERAQSPTWAALGLIDAAMRGASPATVASLDRIDFLEVQEHFRARYPVPAMTLAVVGDVDPALVLARAQTHFGAAPRGRAPAAPPSAAASPARELYRHLAAGDAAVAIAFPAVGRGHREQAALEVAAELLRTGAARAGLVADAESGYLHIHRVCRPDQVPSALAALRRQLERLRAASDADVRRAASRLARAREDALGRAPHAAALLALHDLFGAGARHAAGHAAVLRAVRAADVHAAAARHLRPAAEVVATATPLVASPGAARRMQPVARPARRKVERPARRKVERRAKSRRRR